MNGSRWRVTSIALMSALIISTGLVAAGCGLGDNTTAVCGGAERAFTDFSAELNRVSPTKVAQWKRASGDLADRLGGLSKKADDGHLKKVLATMAAAWRSVADSLGPRDMSRFQSLTHRQPAELASACG